MDEDKPKSKRKKKETASERKPRSAQRDASHKKNWKEYMATVEDIQNFLMDRILLRHNVITGRVEYRLPDSMPPKFFAEQSGKAERGATSRASASGSRVTRSCSWPYTTSSLRRLG